MKGMVIAANMFNEIDQIAEWYQNMSEIADEGILVVDNGSTDGTIEFLKHKQVIVIEDDVILREGYGAARNHLREMAQLYFPNAHWCCYFDADERIDREDYHQLRHIKDNLDFKFDGVAFPRIDWKDLEKKEAAKDWHINPDYQARMTRLGSSLKYIRKLHEQIQGANGIYAELTNPKINHFHRVAVNKRHFIGKLCAKLHMEDDKYGDTYPMHHKEQHYRELLKKEGL